MKLLHDASITAKSLISTLIGALVLIALAGLATFTLLQVQRTMEAANAAVGLRSGSRGVTGDLATGQAALYRAINLKSQNVEVALVRAAKIKSLEAIDHARVSVAALNIAGLEIDPQLLAASAKAVNAYADAAKQAASFVEEDAFNATMFMTDAEQKYTAAEHDVGILLAAAAKVAAAAEHANQQELRSGIVLIPLGSAIAVLLSIAASTVLGRMMSRPIVAMTATMRRLAAGDLAAEIPATDRKDEVGQMAAALLVFRENAREARTLQSAAAQARVLKERRQAAMDRYTQDFGTSAAGVMANLARSAETMRTVAADMSAASQRTRDGAARTAEGASVSAQNLAAVAAAAEEMSASIREISQQVARATDAAHAAVARASDTDTKVASMAELAARIGDVVALISDVAGRTNLLALNATIEAARAGDAGKGFAVVAGEVKALATQTAKATGEISTQITAIRAATADAVSAVREVGAAIGQVEEVATAIAAAVEQQASVTQDIVTSVHNVTTATQEATKAMQEVSAASEHTDAASGKVLEGADAVGRDADTMRAEVTQFLQAMASTSDEDRRAYERIPGNGTHAMLRVPGNANQRVAINDISRGGVSLRCDWSAAAGTEVQVELPGASGAVAARIVRSARGMLALTFRQDAAMLRCVDQALAHIGGGAGRLAA
ncbi:MAG TPA: methyl-accepting chemotaxis protein [Acetobacteraceae bacterium]|jgi:methyl-accepting chemotaxis protein